jgi:hypothetical protein
VCARLLLCRCFFYRARAEKEERKDYTRGAKDKKNADVKQTCFFKKKVKKKTSERETRRDERRDLFFLFLFLFLLLLLLV